MPARCAAACRRSRSQLQLVMRQRPWLPASRPCRCPAPADPRPSARPPRPTPLLYERRQLEERCRDLDITDLQPFYQSPAFREAGFRLAQDGGAVLLARA